jgi:23S rRNA pseudouridine955/2504/2580 synthase
MKTFQINNLEGPVRLDKWARSHLHLTHGLIQKLIRKSDIKINGKRAPKDYKVNNGDVVTIYGNYVEQAPPATRELDKELYSKLLEQIKEAIIFKDENIIAINKPYGVATQSGSNIKISLDDILDGLKFDYEIRPRLVHRLDKSTTGTLLLARTKQVASLFTQYFNDGSIEKKYLAVLAGRLKSKAGTIKSTIAKSGSDDFKEAITKYKELNQNQTLQICLVEFIPITGRTHQIRIHAADELQAPIIGDTKYGGPTSIVPGLDKNIHLHSSEIQIKNLMGKNYSLKSPLPDHMKLAIKKIA